MALSVTGSAARDSLTVAGWRVDAVRSALARAQALVPDERLT